MCLRTYLYLVPRRYQLTDTGKSSYLHRASTVSKHFFITPTDAHNYKITRVLKTIKMPIIAPTYFGSRRNHHQGAISYLTKTTVMILLCSSLMTWSMSWRHTSLLCKHAVHGRERHSSAYLYRVPQIQERFLCRKNSNPFGNSPQLCRYY